jgi:hypothetical protein
LNEASHPKTAAAAGFYIKTIVTAKASGVLSESTKRKNRGLDAILMEATRLMFPALWLIACSSWASIAVAQDSKQSNELGRLFAATAAKVPLPQRAPDPSPTPAENGGLVRLYQVRGEVQLTDSKVAHSDSAAFLIRLSVDGEFVVLHNDQANVRYRITGRRFVYQSEEGQESMQTSAPAIVAACLDQGRVEILTVTPKRLTILQSLYAEEGYRLTTAQFVGEKPLAGNQQSVPLNQKDPPPSQQ